MDAVRGGYKARTRQQPVCSNWMRIGEFINEYAIQVESIRHGQWIESQANGQAITLISGARRQRGMEL